MRLQLASALVVLCLGLFRGARAEDTSDAIAALPDCAVCEETWRLWAASPSPIQGTKTDDALQAECLLTAVLDSTCAPTNQTCICMNEPLQAEVAICVRGACTIKESLSTQSLLLLTPLPSLGQPPREAMPEIRQLMQQCQIAMMNVTATACDAPIRDKSESLNNVATVLGIISGVTVAFRLVFKFWTGMGVSMDDWTILLTVMVGAPNTAISIHGTVANGLGRDIWTLPFDMVTRFGYFFYIMEILYFAVLTVLKVSILFFYLRIFPDAKVRRVLWTTQALNGLSGLAFIIAAIFQCSPISYFWTNWDGEHEGKCINIHALVWANAIASIVFDICILAIPLSQLHKLNLHWKRKVGVALMFIVGTL